VDRSPHRAGQNGPAQSCGLTHRWGRSEKPESGFSIATKSGMAKMTRWGGRRGVSGSESSKRTFDKRMRPVTERTARQRGRAMVLQEWWRAPGFLNDRDGSSQGGGPGWTRVTHAGVGLRQAWPSCRKLTTGSNRVRSTISPTRFSGIARNPPSSTDHRAERQYASPDSAGSAHARHQSAWRNREDSGERSGHAHRRERDEPKSPPPSQKSLPLGACRGTWSLPTPFAESSGRPSWPCGVRAHGVSESLLDGSLRRAAGERGDVGLMKV